MPNVIMNIPQCRNLSDVCPSGEYRTKSDVCPSGEYNENSIFFCDPIKNNIMIDGEFIRIVYSTKNLSLNGICLKLPFKIIGINKYYNKCKYEINLMNPELEQIKAIEMNILQKINIRGKRTQCNIYEHLLSGYVKTIGDCKNEPDSIVLKISGVWETDTECGITYKFITML